MQGHSQVSSFGFGGANGHGIKLVSEKLAKRPFPQVRVTGKDPNDWEADFPDMRACRNGAKFSTTMTKETPDDEAVIWKLEEDGPEPEDDDDTFYSITGNFNDWQDDRMT